MTKTPAGKLFAGFLLFLGSISQLHAQGPKTAADMLDRRLAPKHDHVVVSTPSAEELKSCTIASVPGASANSGGYLFQDANKKPLRRFFDSKGAGKVDVWSYYKDGIEVYREFDTGYKGTPNNFRWLNAGGMKWGVGGVDPTTGQGYITSWIMISAEEAAFEAFQAIARQDFARLQTLFITDKDVQTLKLPASQARRIADLQSQAPKKFSELSRTINLAGAKFEVVEGGVPSCDTTGDVETIRYSSRAIRYEIKGEHKWIHTGEMIRVGMTWRLLDVPSDKDPVGATSGGVIEAKTGSSSPELEAVLKLLAEHDLKPPPPAPILGKNAEVQKYYDKRIDLVQKIVRLDAPEQREGWYKQLFDNYTAAAQNSGNDTALKALKDSVVGQMPGSNLAAYGVYRHAWTRYALDVYLAGEDPKKNAAAQDKWLDDLADFVNRYSKAEDTPEALHQLAIGCEFGGQTAKAKRWYTQLAESYPNHQLAARSRGSVDRLDLVGNPMKLSAARLDTGAAFDIAQLKGKLVIVHYWRSQNSDQYKDDFARLKLRLSGAKDLELVSVNLDDDAAAARDAVARVQAPGVHLYQSPSNNAGGGLNNPLATQYGIHVMPTLFLVNRDGRVTSNSLQIGDIETELRKVQ